MALQDLTPQLRTRLSRMERAVGWFVVLAVGLLVFGFVYYVYTTAERKGWFKTKAPYFTFTLNAIGLKVGDPVRLMGFDVGQITEINAMPADQFSYNVYIEFHIKEPYYDYMWSEGSRAKVAAADLLGKRVLEVSKGTGGYPTYIFFPLHTNVTLAEARSLPDLSKWALAQEIARPGDTNLAAKPWWGLMTNLNAIQAAGYTAINVMDTREKRRTMTGIWNDREARYDPFSLRSKFWLQSDESPAITERLENVVTQVEQALPNILALTNQLANVLSNSASLTSNLNQVALSARPALSNITAATTHLGEPGALGEWLLPTNLNRELESTLTNASATMATANTNLIILVQDLSRSLDNLADMTSNLNSQVQANTNLLSTISQTIVHADQFVQGLKQHWLFRSAFKTKKNNAAVVPAKPLASPKEKGKP
jgi:ABC-type transporter Mla subunit MlaD